MLTSTTRTIDIDAPPAAIWPWLAQMGPAPRGGAYTYDWIENLMGLDMHSTDQVLEEFQDPQVGDAIEFGANRMRLTRVDPERELVWCTEDGNWEWSFRLEQSRSGTRLVSRNRFRLRTLAGRLALLPMRPASWVMERKMLRGIKRRAELLVLRPAVERVSPPARLVRLANPVVRAVLRSPLHKLLDRHLMVLRFSGRRSGRDLFIPVTRQDIDGRLTVVSDSVWRNNFSGGRDVRLLLDGKWVQSRGMLVADADRIAGAYERRFAELGWKQGARRLGVKVNVGRAPTREELAEGIRTTGLALVHFDLP
jgi:hypothetical protein